MGNFPRETARIRRSSDRGRAEVFDLAGGASFTPAVHRRADVARPGDSAAFRRMSRHDAQIQASIDLLSQAGTQKELLARIVAGAPAGKSLD